MSKSCAMYLYRVVVAPMLTSANNAAFSNFWMDQDSRVSCYCVCVCVCVFISSMSCNSQGYYKRHEDYMPILQWNFTGCFRAPVLLPPLLVQLSSPLSQNLVYHPPPDGFNGPTDDIVQFAFSAKIGGWEIHVCTHAL